MREAHKRRAVHYGSCSDCGHSQRVKVSAGLFTSAFSANTMPTHTFAQGVKHGIHNV